MIDTLTGAERHHTLRAIRSLLSHCKKNRSVFRDPAARLRAGEQPRQLITPLADEEIDKVVRHAFSPTPYR
ncbi:hypothetical protein [Actinomadura kijaniata]|uniref:hypothetical protein n=1 Tax=Actinomadura kijaniata TaxID=46161 RepID=UPI000B0FEE75|nr:hypothetical protein [Actinomadura kijaniata]